MNKMLIDAQLAQAILNYLGTRPYIEVADMVTELLKLETLEQVKANEAKTED